MAELIARVAARGATACAPAFDNDGRLLVSGGADSRIYMHDHAAEGDGALIDFASTGGAPCGLAFDSEGTLYAADTALAAIVALDGGAPKVVVDSYEGRPLKGPTSLVHDSSGQLFFTDSGAWGETGLTNPKGSVFLVTGEAGGSRMLRPLALDSLAYPCACALSPTEAALFVAEQAANRILRFTQRPAGVWHASVWHTFSGRLGPSAIVFDRSRGLVYVARPESPELAETGIVSVLSADGHLLRDIETPGAEISGLALSPDGSHLIITEATTNTVHKLLL